MLKPRTTPRFEKDYGKARDSGRDISRLKRVMVWISSEEPLPTELHDHPLLGTFKGRRECHFAGDRLLIYKLEQGAVVFECTGSHSELFGR